MGEATLSLLRRIGAPEERMLIVRGNLACTYGELGRHEEAMRIRRDVYSGALKLRGESHEGTFVEAINYASSLRKARHFAEAKSLMRKTIPVARGALGKDDTITLRMRWIYAQALYADTGGTLDDLREAVETLEETARTARRVFGGTHPLTKGIVGDLRDARAALRTREWGPLVLAVAIAVVGWVSGARFFAVALVVFTWLWRR